MAKKPVCMSAAQKAAAAAQKKIVTAANKARRIAKAMNQAAVKAGAWLETPKGTARAERRAAQGFRPHHVGADGQTVWKATRPERKPARCINPPISFALGARAFA